MKEEEDWRKKEEAEKEAKEKATVDAQKRQIKVSPHFFHSFRKLIMFQMLKKQKDVCNAQLVDIGGVSTSIISGVWNKLGLDRHCILQRSRVQS